MPAQSDDAASRRSVVPSAAGRSLWLAAGWTGLAPVLVGALLGVVGVAICWLPVSGHDGNAGSVFRAGVLTFLAGVHGGITVDGVAAGFVPLGLTVAVAVLTWRAGTGLADAAAVLDEDDPARLVRAGALQAGTFAVACLVAARLSVLGTSHAPALGALLAGAVLFLVTGSVAFARASGLGAGLVGARVASMARAALAGVVVYLGAGALLVAGALFLHRDRVELLSAHLGAGWSGAPVLLLGVLAAPNAAAAGAAYLAGPGFAVGHGSAVSLGGAAHGTLPAFPLLGAIPSGPAGTAAWLLVAATPVLAGSAIVRVVRAGTSTGEAWVRLAGGIVGVATIGAVITALAGGAIGDGRLATIGASPWQFGLAAAAGCAAVAAPALAGLIAIGWWRRRSETDAALAPIRLSTVPPVDDPADVGDGDGADQLAG